MADTNMADTNMPDANTMYLTTEHFTFDGTCTHNALVAAQKTDMLQDIVNTLCLGPIFYAWDPHELAYGVIKAQDAVQPHHFPQHAPTALQWWVNRQTPWSHMTVEQFFEGVHKEHDEHYFLVITKLDLRINYDFEFAVSRHRRANAEKAVFWLKDLYIDKLTRMLRQLKSHA
jgi:hypothetical protein